VETVIATLISTEKNYKLQNKYCAHKSHNGSPNGLFDSQNCDIPSRVAISFPKQVDIGKSTSVEPIEYETNAEKTTTITELLPILYASFLLCFLWVQQLV
jgi:hypothetical protein